MSNVNETRIAAWPAMRLICLASLLAAALLVSACSPSPEDEIMELARCLKVAKERDDGDLARGVVIAMRKINFKGSEARLAMYFGEKLNDELFPAGSSTDPLFSMKKLASWAESSRCVELAKIGSVPKSRVSAPASAPGSAPVAMPAPPPSPTPEVSGITVPQFEGECGGVDAKIRAAGFVPKSIEVHGPVDPDAAGVGCAYRQNPKAGSVLPPGSEISFRRWSEAG